MNTAVRLGLSLLCGALLAVPAAALAQQVPDQGRPAGENTRYDNDILHIAVREAPSAPAGLVKVIPSGTRMEILETAPDEAFTRVRLASGEQGWVLSRFLTDEPIARDRLEAALARTERLERENGRLQSALGEVRSERDALSEQASGLQRRNAQLTEELERIRATSAEAVALDQENRRLTAELETARKARRAAERAAEAGRSQLYTTGGIAAVLGLGVGFYIGYTPVRREKRWRKMPKM